MDYPAERQRGGKWICTVILVLCCLGSDCRFGACLKWKLFDGPKFIYCYSKSAAVELNLYQDEQDEGLISVIPRMFFSFPFWIYASLHLSTFINACILWWKWLKKFLAIISGITEHYAIHPFTIWLPIKQREVTTIWRCFVVNEIPYCFG